MYLEKSWILCIQDAVQFVEKLYQRRVSLYVGSAKISLCISRIQDVRNVEKLWNFTKKNIAGTANAASTILKKEGQCGYIPKK